MRETGLDTGVFESTRMILVSDWADKASQPDRIVTTLGGIGSLEYGGARTNFTCSAALEKTVNVNIRILRYQPNHAETVIQRSAVESDVAVAKERFAQVGVTLNVTISVVNPPTAYDARRILQPAAETATLVTPSTQEQAIMDGPGMRTATYSDIEVYYVLGFPTFAQQGEAIFPRYLPSNSPYRNSVFMSASRRSPFALAHELGHVLTNNQHFLSPVNLMNDGVSNAYLSGVTKRLTEAQQTEIFNNTELNSGN